jgi:lipopolysaccharide biosynthesis protein
MTFDTKIVESLSAHMGITFKYSSFPAGSMFWFRQSALSRLLLLDGSMFSPEEGLADGTTAHGVERLFSIIASEIGYKTISIEA